jgi:hypothetical protein
MPTKQKILDEVRRTAHENDGIPLGVARFEKETGIKQYEWGKFWARYGDVLKEAGFTPNQLQTAYSTEFLIEKVVGLVRKLGKFPTYREIQVEKNNDPELPDKKVFGRLGTQEQLAKKVLEHCNGKEGYNDVLKACGSVLEKPSKQSKDAGSSAERLGEVYLFKSGRYFKIGKTIDTVRRGSEIRIQLPERVELIHSIMTDDPSGIEAYWHKRFDPKRLNGEWFDLNTEDVKTFKRWKRIY